MQFFKLTREQKINQFNLSHCAFEGHQFNVSTHIWGIEDYTLQNPAQRKIQSHTDHIFPYAHCVFPYIAIGRSYTIICGTVFDSIFDAVFRSNLEFTPHYCMFSGEILKGQLHFSYSETCH